MSLSKKIKLFLALCIYIQAFSQEKIQKLDSVVINSSRISLPFKKNSRTINIVSEKTLKIALQQMLQTYYNKLQE